MKYLIVFTLFFSSDLLAQDTPAFDEPVFEDENTATANSPEIENAAPLDIEAIEGQITEENLPSTGQSETEQQTQGDFDVFQPSEEISEDLSVPFPADI